MNELIEKLEKKEWVIDFIGNKVNSELAAKVIADRGPHKFVSNTYLTSLFYRQKKGDVYDGVPLVKPSNITFIYNQSEYSKFFSRSLDEVFKQVSISNNNYSQNLLNDWMLEFKNDFCKYSGSSQIVNFLEYIVLLENVTFQGASHPHYLSTLFIKNPDKTEQIKFYLSVIHESAHQELFLINFLDRLVNEKYDYNMIHAPYQNKKRPPIGRLHSLHALYRMIQFSLNNKIESEHVLTLKNKFLENINSFSQGELTEFGFNLIKKVYEEFKKDI